MPPYDGYTDTIEIGPTPADEDCAQVGDPGYWENVHDECNRFIQLIRKNIGIEPAGAKLDIKGSRHEFGTYYEVVVRFDRYLDAAIDYAYRVDAEAPRKWE